MQSNLSGIKKKILVVDDESDVRELLVDILGEHYEVLTATNGREAMQIVRLERPQVTLLNTVMPDIDGYMVCERIRLSRETRNVFMIMMSINCDIENRVLAFRAGADDFITKPFHITDLLARIESKFMRVAEKNQEACEIQCGNLVLHVDRYEAMVNGVPVLMSVLEFNVLCHFARNRDKVLSRQQVVDSVWQGTKVSARNIDTHIVSLRRKLINFDYSLITVYGAGYILKKSEHHNRVKAEKLPPMVLGNIQ